MFKDDQSSSFCRSCTEKAEIKIMCPLIGSLCGFGCISLSHCVHCVHHLGIDLKEYKIKCSYGKKDTKIIIS